MTNYSISMAIYVICLAYSIFGLNIWNKQDARLSQSDHVRILCSQPDIFTISQALNPTTSSTTWYMHYKDVPELLTLATTLLDTTVYQLEEPQIVRYETGQHFGWHSDALPVNLCWNGGQRVATVLVYLNDVPVLDGGATAFKQLNFKVQPTAGTALIFFPCAADGTVDHRTEHAGQMTMSTKWIAQLWVRQREYTPSIPFGTSQSEGADAVASYLLQPQQSKGSEVTQKPSCA